MATLMLAAVAVSKAPTQFHSLAFLAGLIGYHRILWALNGMQTDDRRRWLSLNYSLTRLEYRSQGREPPDVASSEWNNGEDERTALREARRDVLELEERRQLALRVWAAAELALMGAVLFVALL